MRLVLIGVAGAVGALGRYGISRAVGRQSFPWATLSINVVGSFLLGLLVAVAIAHDWHEDISVPLAVGLLGAFTTYSTFSVETHELLRTGRAGAAASYVAASLVGGVAAAALGWVLVR